ncbi:hypothetical protein JOF53_005731 [Crossiella equi]|uniref:Uncharacterized protein n=1 Tax=Crossiella equi TaxID=130796 RepID=A0ABS5AKV7_9PSEU|nr:hypothetical protein [Crossiella equi]
MLPFDVGEITERSVVVMPDSAFAQCGTSTKTGE